MTTKTIKHWDLKKGSQDLGYDTYNCPIDSTLHGIRYNGTDYIIDESEEKLENCGLAKIKNPNATNRDELKLIAPDKIWKIISYDPKKEIAKVEEVRDSKLILDLLAELEEEYCFKAEHNILPLNLD